MIGSLQEPVIEADDLTLLDGIGPAFATRLNEGGVYTFEKLAQMTPEEIRNTARLQSWQDEPEGWIAEARERIAGN